MSSHTPEASDGPAGQIRITDAAPENPVSERITLAELARRFGVVEDPTEDPDGRRLNPFDAY